MSDWQKWAYMSATKPCWAPIFNP